MELEVGFRYLSMMLEVLLLDLLLSSDNIVMIALVYRSLPEAKRRLGLLLGTGAVIVLRALLITGTRFVLKIPGLKLLGWKDRQAASRNRGGSAGALCSYWLV